MILEKLRNFLATPAGRISSAVFAVIMLAAAFVIARGALVTDGQSQAGFGTFIDAETKLPFDYQMKAGERLPVKAPSGGKGFPAEICNWTADGHVDSVNTPVLLNDYVGIKGPTFCPKCGRLVTPHNEPAFEGAKPPPTKTEYEKERR